MSLTWQGDTEPLTDISLILTLTLPRRESWRSGCRKILVHDPPPYLTTTYLLLQSGNSSFLSANNKTSEEIPGGT